MPCVSLPKPELPPLPAIGFSLPSLGAQDLDASLCCKVPPVSTPAIPNPIPPLALNADGIITIIDTALNEIEAYVDKLPLSCPKE